MACSGITSMQRQIEPGVAAGMAAAAWGHGDGAACASPPPPPPPPAAAAAASAAAAAASAEQCSSPPPAPPPAGELQPTSVGGPTPTESRVGRDKQRYTDDGARLVAGCIPARYRNGAAAGPACAADVEVLLITSRGGKGWVLPKGGWEDDEDVEAAALRETVEEAGVRGALERPIVGAFAFQSGKQARLRSARQGRCVAHLFVMRVEEELPSWPEAHARQRRWMPLEEAARLCRHAWMRDALRAWARGRGWELLDDAGGEPLHAHAQPLQQPPFGVGGGGPASESMSASF